MQRRVHAVEHHGERSAPVMGRVGRLYDAVLDIGWLLICKWLPALKKGWGLEVVAKGW